jgi:ubiquitin C-terminal hydrolase
MSFIESVNGVNTKTTKIPLSSSTSFCGRGIVWLKERWDAFFRGLSEIFNQFINLLKGKSSLEVAVEREMQPLPFCAQLPKQTPPRPFLNIGNSCYLNSAVQLLLGSDLLVQKLESIKQDNLIDSLIEFIKTPDENSASFFRFHIKNKFKVFKKEPITTQQDATDVLIPLIDRLGVSHQTYSVFSNSFETEQFENFQKPQILTLQINREDESGAKRKASMRSPQEVFNFYGTSYKLIGVMRHKGASLSSGHYVAYSLRGTSWFRCDDKEITEAKKGALEEVTEEFPIQEGPVKESYESGADFEELLKNLSNVKDPEINTLFLLQRVDDESLK